MSDTQGKVSAHSRARLVIATSAHLRNADHHLQGGGSVGSGQATVSGGCRSRSAEEERGEELMLDFLANGLLI